MIRKIPGLLLGLTIIVSTLKAQHQADTSKVVDWKWYNEAKYGLFLHYGLYAIPAGSWKGKDYKGVSEWIQQKASIPIKEYEALASQFNPTRFNAEEWVLFAKNAGLRYIVITAKHHDGFAMFKSDVSKFNIVDASPFKRDMMKELADACKKHNMKLGFYYSQTVDWHERDAVGNNWDYKDYPRDFSRFLEEKCKPQLRELLTNYGEISVIWFDGGERMRPEHSKALVDWVHQFQPNCLTTTRVGNGMGELIALGDNELPKTKVKLPFEALFTHNIKSWGYSLVEKELRTPREIITILLTSSAKGGNLLLNLGPKPDGTFQQESVRDLNVVGKWINANAEAIYDTQTSPLPDVDWGYVTAKPGVLYLHIMNWPNNGKLIIPLKGAVKASAKLLVGSSDISSRLKSEQLIITLPQTGQDEICTVVKVNYTGNLNSL